MNGSLSALTASKTLLLCLLLSLSAVSCSAQRKSETIQVGPDAKMDLLIYFTSDATEEQIKEFINKDIMRQDPNGKGFRLPDGAQMFLKIFPPVEGHEGVALRFFEDTPQEKKVALKRTISSFPLVYTILEEMAPADVKSLESESPAKDQKEERGP